MPPAGPEDTPGPRLQRPGLPQPCLLPPQWPHAQQVARVPSCYRTGLYQICLVLPQHCLLDHRFWEPSPFWLLPAWSLLSELLYLELAYLLLASGHVWPQAPGSLVPSGVPQDSCSADAMLCTRDWLSIKPQLVALFPSGPQAHPPDVGHKYTPTEEVLRLLYHFLLHWSPSLWSPCQEPRGDTAQSLFPLTHGGSGSSMVLTARGPTPRP